MSAAFAKSLIAIGAGLNVVVGALTWLNCFIGICDPPVGPENIDTPSIKRVRARSRARRNMLSAEAHLYECHVHK